MKKQKIFNFALSVTCAAVLSACGSSGGGSLAVDNANTTPAAPTANATPSTNTGSGTGDNSAALTAAQQAAQKAENEKLAAKAEADKAKAEADKAKAEADKAKAEAAKLQAEKDAAAKKAADEQAQKDAAAKKEADEKAAREAAFQTSPLDSKEVLQAKPDNTTLTSFSGMKHVVKDRSNLETNTSKVRDSKSDTPTAMKVQDLDASLDTFVVGQRSQKEAGAPLTYIEDFDTRTASTAAWAALNGVVASNQVHAKKANGQFMADKSIGNTAIQHIYIDSITRVGAQDSQSANPVTEARRRELTEAQNNANRQLNNLLAAAARANTTLVTFENTLDGFRSNVNPGRGHAAPATDYVTETRRLDGIAKDINLLTSERERAQNELNVLVSKYKELSAAVTRAEEPVEKQRIALENARNSLNEFQAKNPSPRDLVQIDQARKGESADSIVNINNIVINTVAAARPAAARAAADTTTTAAATAAAATAARQTITDMINRSNLNDAQKNAVIAAMNANINQVANRRGATPEDIVYALEALANDATLSNNAIAVAGVTVNRDGSLANYDTKTDTMGTKIGAIWTLSEADIKNRHQNFTEHSSQTNPNNVVRKGFVLRGETDLNGNLQVDKFDVRPLSDVQVNSGWGAASAQVVGLRTQDNSVAEVYGFRSKALDTFEKPLDKTDKSVESDNLTTANNVPLLNNYEGAKAQFVQYGRITSALSDRASTDDFYKEGLRLNLPTDTYVASFGEYGEAGTENHYFYRGINNVGGVELTELKKDTKNGVITYEGHAVTYGLNNNYMGNRQVPNALSDASGFVSGNHAKAAVNLATNAVTGSVYNKWYDPKSPKALRDIDLVQFKGNIADNGNIAGEATRVDNQTKGLFGATLYGAGAELGGVFASDNKDADRWGGSFIGIRTGVQAAPVNAPQDTASPDNH